LVECWLPYGKTEVHVSVALRNLLATVEPAKSEARLDPRSVLLEALQSPIGSQRIDEVVKTGTRCALAVDGTLNPRLAAPVVSTLVVALGGAGARPEDLSVLIGNGSRDRGDPDLLESLRGVDALKGIGVESLSSRTGGLRQVGETSAGTRVQVSGTLADADFKLVVGEVLTDHLSGFSGAHTTILPQLSGPETIVGNRSLSFDEGSASGAVDGNPVFDDVMEAAEMVGPDLALNLVTDQWGSLTGARAGGIRESLAQAIDDLGESYRLRVEGDADVIIVSAGGRKFDYDLYNSIWALGGVAGIAKKGATIILLAECSEGLGAPGLDKLSRVDNLAELRRRYMLGAKAVYLIKSTLRSNEVVLVSALPNYLAEPLGFGVERTANDALEAVSSRRRGRKTLVVTHGCSTIPYAA
jgi:nickel-dependent lactate racemase